MADEDGGTSCDRSGNGLSGEPAGELRFEVVFKLSDVGAAEKTREDCQEGTSGGCDVFAAREGHDRHRIVGECGHVLVSRLPAVQPKAEPGTVDRGEPGTLAKWVEVGLILSLDKALAKGLDRSLVEGLVRTLAQSLAESEDEDDPEALASCNLKDLAAVEPTSLRVGKPVRIPSPGRPHGVGCTSVTSVLAVSVNISCRAVDERSWIMAVKTVRKGLNRETREAQV